MSELIKGEASTQYGDWQGTASGDSSSMNNIDDIYTLAGLDSGNGIIVGIGAGWVSAKDNGVHTDVRVYVHTPEDGEKSNMQAIMDKYPTRSDIPVKEVLLHDLTPEQFALVFNQFDIQLRSRFLGDRNLRVTNVGDHPPQS